MSSTFRLLAIVIFACSTLGVSQALAVETRSNPVCLESLALKLTKALERQDLRPRFCSQIDFISLGSEVNKAVDQASSTDDHRALDLAEQIAQGFELLVVRCNESGFQANS